MNLRFIFNKNTIFITIISLIILFPFSAFIEYKSSSTQIVEKVKIWKEDLAQAINENSLIKLEKISNSLFMNNMQWISINKNSQKLVNKN